MRDARSARDDLAQLIRRENSSVVASNCKLARPALADRAALAPLRRKAVGRDQPDLAETIGLEDRHLEASFESFVKRIGKSGGAGMNEAQTMLELAGAERKGALQHSAMQGRSAGIPAR